MLDAIEFSGMAMPADLATIEGGTGPRAKDGFNAMPYTSIESMHGWCIRGVGLPALAYM